MKLLLHICCGPCALYPLSVLQEEGITFEGFFYNPNIHPWEEFQRRKENLKKVSEEKGFPVVYREDFEQEKWEAFQGLEQERCQMCYRLRLEETARYAKENGFDGFTTTLLVSPYQNHEMMIQLGEALAKKYGISFFYRDFRQGFRQGQQEAKDMGIYRQKYCGCILSKRV